MGTIAIPFTEEMHSTILREARRKHVQPEVLLKVWILERAMRELEPEPGREAGRSEEQRIDSVDLLSLPLKFGFMFVTSATATVSRLVDEISR